MALEELLTRVPYQDGCLEKQNILLKRMNELTEHHYQQCQEYRCLIDYLYDGKTQYCGLSEIPMLPVKIFKKIDLRSVSEEDIFKTMTSSGTTGQQVSKIFLNRQTANNQQKVLTRIVSDFTGHSRMPMIILDCPSVLKNRNMFSARGAGILGFSLFGSKKVYAFNDEMELNFFELKQFLEKYEGRTIFLFGLHI